MNAPAPQPPAPQPRRHLARGSVRELVLLGAGIALVIVGVASRPRDPAVIGVGTTLLLATPAVAHTPHGHREEGPR